MQSSSRGNGHLNFFCSVVPHEVGELAISYLIHYRSDFDAVKSKVGLLDEYIPFSYKASL